MKHKTTALILRNDGDGIAVFGKILTTDLLETDAEHLFLGEVEIKPKEVFTGLKDGLKGNTPNHLLTNGGLNYKNYNRKLNAIEKDSFIGFDIEEMINKF